MRASRAVVLGLALVCVESSFAQSSGLPPGSWISVGPNQASVYTLRFSLDEAQLWAGTGGCGAFRTTDGATTWASIATGIGDQMVVDLAQSSSSPSTWYAAGGTSLYKSTTSGASWSAVLSPPSFINPQCVRLLPADNNIIFAGSGSGLWRSLDGGSSWGKWPLELDSDTITVLGVDPHHPAHIWVGTERGPYKSTDSGGSFSLMNVGLGSALGQAVITSLLFHPSLPNTVFCGTWDGIVRSTNGGASWAPVTSPHAYVYALSAAPPGAAGTMVAATTEGLIRSDTSDGTSWSLVRSGTHVAVATSQSLVVAAESIGRVFKSADTGQTWTTAGTMGRPEVVGVALSPTSQTALAILSSKEHLEATSIWKSTNAGRTWTGLSSFPTSVLPLGVAFDAAGVAYVAAIQTSGGAAEGVLTSTTAFLGDDSTTTWSWLQACDYRRARYNARIAAHPTLSGRVLYSSQPLHSSTFESDAFYYGGAPPWAPAYLGSSGITSMIVLDQALRDSSEAWLAGVSSESGRGLLLKSTSINGDVSWQQCGTTAIDNEALLAIELAPQSAVLYVGTDGEGAFKSIDGGLSFTPINSGLSNLVINDLALCLNDPARLFAATDGGVFKSFDAGQSWTSMPTFGFSRVTAIDTSADGRIVVVGASGGGLWYYRFP